MFLSAKKRATYLQWKNFTMKIYLTVVKIFYSWDIRWCQSMWEKSLEFSFEKWEWYAILMAHARKWKEGWNEVRGKMYDKSDAKMKMLFHNLNTLSSRDVMRAQVLHILSFYWHFIPFLFCACFLFHENANLENFLWYCKQKLNKLIFLFNIFW